MKSPFPGMDPYLERRWQDVHQSICTYARDQLNEQLGKGLVARLGERLIVESLLDESRTIYPDVRVVEAGIAGIDWSPSTAAGTTSVEPVVINVATEPVPQPFIQIMEADSSRLVTVVEFLSPSNKVSGDGRDSYKQKQRELYAAHVSLAEIDLIRTGTRTFLIPAAHFPADLHAAYFACIFRGWNRSRFEVYPLPLRQKLDPSRIPLRRNEPDVVLDLQSLVDQAYRNGRYDRTNYREPCAPPLASDDAAWADELLKTAGKR